jgi:DUF1009 family protein
MSAPEEKRIEPSSIKKLGILAGGGELPFVLLEACKAQGIEPFVIAFEGQADAALTDGYNHLWTRLGALNTVFKTLKSHGISDLVLIGSIRRPSMAEIRPDLKATKFLAKAGVKALGDDGMLKALRDLFEEEGFALHGMHQFAQQLLAPEGVIGRSKPAKDDWEDIERGVEVLTGMGALDVGQAVIVQEGLVLGVEAVEGTGGLIERCKPLKRKGRGGVLVKLCKAQQDRNLDLPTVGPKTIEMAAACGLNGVVIHAGQSLLLNAEQVAKIADQHNMFVYGYTHPTDTGS